ncbi:MAG: metal-dependent hydrolase [Chitinophagales bacterium]|nr:metal-dependent hydrolase [Bacteroidota bacterium]MCB9042496.1 metal-dependent hydrolase [Chitinophagales bacterium]
MKITYYGHACFGVEIAGKKLLFDPFIRPNPLAKHINIDDIAADYILLSHGHEDHVADALYLAERNKATIIACFEICTWFAQKFNYNNSIAMNIGGKVQTDVAGIKAVAAIHSSVLPDGTYGGNPMGFVIDSKEGDFYYSGDTALSMDMKLIPAYAHIDFMFLCIGDVFTMGIDDAIRAADFLDCKYTIGMHFNTFDPIKIDKSAAIQRFRDKKYELKLLEIGETIHWKA